jgi:1-deoxy-D-xylulose-5-phosphate reductoisomerase
MKKVAILGSTGSVGRNTINVIKNLDDYEIFALYAGNNISLLIKQAEEFNPLYVGTFFRENEKKLDDMVGGRWRTLFGIEGASELAANNEIDAIVIASAGSLTYEILIKALENGKRVATANKETIVAYSTLLKKKLPDMPGKLIPVDSEHSAIYQSLLGANRSDIRRVILPASGGPFNNRESLDGITAREALNHPTWQMGKKITIDSATLMNKALEVIEASVLFNLSPDEIEVVIHPQSIVHGMVEYKDGSVIAQLSKPDMKIPIQFALTAPEHVNSPAPKLVISDVEALTFHKVDEKKFPLIPLAYYVLGEGGTLPAVFVAADEVAVSAFLSGKIKFREIMDIVREVTESHSLIEDPGVEDIINAEEWAFSKARELIE